MSVRKIHYRLTARLLFETSSLSFTTHSHKVWTKKPHLEKKVWCLESGARFRGDDVRSELEGSAEQKKKKKKKGKGERKPK